LFPFKTDPAIILSFGAWRNPPLQVFIGLSHQAFRKLSSSFFSSLKPAHRSAQVSALLFGLPLQHQVARFFNR
jgi:hypothetical protein